MFGKVFVVFQELFVVFADMGHRNILICSESLNLRKNSLILREKFITNHRIRTLFSVIKTGSLSFDNKIVFYGLF